MSFNLSRTQFLQMFAVMQSIRLINSHTSVGAAPGLVWYNGNVLTDQFSVLTNLLAATPTMPNLDALPSGSTAPILINPFAEGGYLPYSGPGFVTIPETGELNINESALFGAMESHFSIAFTNLIRKANESAGHVTMPGVAFANFYIEYNPDGPAHERAKLCFVGEDGGIARIEVALPHVFYADRRKARQLIDILSYFIGQSMIDADVATGSLISDVVNVVDKLHAYSATRAVEKTLEQKLMECPIWASW
ncbi:hypothetical protein ACOB7R_003748 [Enterobacter hormaechei]